MINLGSGNLFDDVDIILTRVSGEVDLYVSDSIEKKPEWINEEIGVSKKTYTVSSEEEGDDIISLKRSDFKACNDESNCYYIVGVFGKQYTKNEFSIVTKYKSSIVGLDDAIPVRGRVDPNSYEFYSIKVSDPNSDVQVIVTPFDGGDPDLYISANSSHPTKEDYDWAGRGFGADVVTIQAAELNKHCKPQEMDNGFCSYYISVFGWTNTSYSLMATLSDGWQNPSTLISTSPQNGQVDDGVYQYYIYRTPEHLDVPIHITLSPLDEADVDLYVTVYTKEQQQAGDSPREPGKDQYDYKSSGWAGIDEIWIIPNDDDNFCSTCDVFIAVYGYHGGDFTITVTLGNENQHLQLGTPVSSTTTSKLPSYYEVTWSDTSLDLIVSLTRNSGRSKLFASCKTEFPSAESKMHSFEGSTNDKSPLIITAEQISDYIDDCISKPTEKAVTMYIAVFPDSENPDTSEVVDLSTFTLMVTMDSLTDIPILVAGTPVSGSIKFERFQYYQIRLGKKYVDVDVILTPISGETDLYVSESVEMKPQYDQDRGVYNYIIGSKNAGEDVVTIDHTLFSSCASHSGSQAEDASECYYIVGVFGRDYTKNEYTIVSKFSNSVTTLQNGVAYRDFVAPHSYEYYKFAITNPKYDLRISVTPFTGDPDIYVGVPPIYHPSLLNYTFASRSFGADTLTLQASELSNYCTPSETVPCEYYIGVYGWTNTSFSILASVQNDWANPIVLTTGTPQSGSIKSHNYDYYSYYINKGTKKIRFILSSFDGTDEDLYLSFKENQQPGKETYDYKATSWSGDDVIELRPQNEGWCTDCTVYLAVYAYEGGDYTLTVDAGMVRLQSGVPVTGHLEMGTISYYKILNPDAGKEIDISVTSLNGDADIYVKKSITEDDGDVEVPTKDDYTWRSNHLGDDSLTILPNDPDYCGECDYIIGVYGWTNTSFSILASVEAMVMIPLIDGRPQTYKVKQDELVYFSASLGNSAESLRMSLTIIAGGADVFAAEYKNIIDVSNQGIETERKLPDPNDPDSFQYTTANSVNNELTIPGPHNNLTSYVFGVYGTDSEETEFTILVSYSQSSIQLQDGVPTTYAAASGSNIYFHFPITSDADITVSVTAISGDPDVLLSTKYEKPKCTARSSGVGFDCDDYTWLSQQYSSDVITLSHAVPCDKSAAHIQIADDCTPDMLKSGHVLHITVYAWQDAAFSILVSTRGGHMVLVPGRPQLSTTSLSKVCGERTSAGTCDTSKGSTVEEKQVAYFKLKISPEDNIEDANVVIDIEPNCDHSVSPCQAGCDCNPLTLYVKSCLESECTQNDKYPSGLEDNYLISHEVSNKHHTLFIAHDPNDPNNGFCNPTKAADGKGSGNCIYYIAVVSSETDEKLTSTFHATVSTPNDITILSTTRGGTSEKDLPPDGILISTLDKTINDKQKNYQLYIPPEKPLSFQLEVCEGNLELLLCDDTCPNLYPTMEHYIQYADDTKNCKEDGKDCSTSESSIPTIDSPSSEQDLVFLGVHGQGKYFLNILMKNKDGSVYFPKLNQPQSTEVSASNIKAGEVKITWEAAQISISSSSSSITPLETTYYIYAFEEDQLKHDMSFGTNDARYPVLSTSCGVEAYYEKKKDTSKMFTISSTSGNTNLHYTAKGLKAGTKYNFNIIAECNSDCLAQVSKTTESSKFGINCSGASQCQSQQTVYASVSTTTSGSAGDDTTPSDNDEDDSEKSGSSVFAAFLMIFVIASLGMAIYMITTKLRRPNRSYTTSTFDDGFEMQTGFATSPSSGTSSYMPPMFNTPGRGGSTKTGRYTPLSNDEM